MKKILLLLLVILGINDTHAQTQEIDSLKQLLQNEKTDTARVLRLADLSLASIHQHPVIFMVLNPNANTICIRVCA